MRLNTAILRVSIILDCLFDMCLEVALLTIGFLYLLAHFGCMISENFFIVAT